MNMRAYANNLLHRMAERQLDEPDTGSLTDAEQEAVNAEVALRASNECDECVDLFRDWLNSAPGRRARQDYAEWRAHMLSEDEQREIETLIGIRK